MTPAEFAQILVALVAFGGFLLSMQSTSYNELHGLYESVRKDNETIRRDFDQYKKDSEEKEGEYEKRVDELVKQVQRFRRYIDVLIKQLQQNNIVPHKMDDE